MTQDLDMYDGMASWFHLLTPPAEYEDEAAFALELFQRHVDGPLDTLLELGSGGGNMASHLKRAVAVTLTDLSPAMLDASRSVNPEAEHLVGDMRTLRLGRTFDAVLIHDAICYMTDEIALREAMATALVHLRPGGVAVLEPDYVREIFRTGTDCGGDDSPETAADGSGRGMRYLEWVTDPDPADTTYQVDYAMLLRHADGRVEVRQDRHIEGLFPRATWLALLEDVGFDPIAVDDEAEGRIVFVGRRPG